MSYLKIFPKSIVIKPEGVNAYVGHMQYDFEQYGQMLYGYETAVKLTCETNICMRWQIKSTDKTHTLSGFLIFMNALNHYLFDVLQFDPVSQCRKLSDIRYEYFFERVYFDMDTQKFKSLKETQKYSNFKTLKII